LATESLVQLIDRFITGDIRSVKYVHELGLAIDDAVPDDEFQQETVLMLTSYRPGGGEYHIL